MSDPARKPELRIINNDLPAFEYHIRQFLDAKAGKSPRTVEGYRSVLYLFRDHVGAHYLPGSAQPPPGTPSWPPTAAGIDSFLIACKARGLKDTTIDDYYRSLRVWLTWLYRRGILSTNPIDLAERPPRPKLLPRAPRHQDLQKLFVYLETVAGKGRGHWRDVRALALWSLALDTGLRAGELAALNVGDLTLSKRRRSVFVRGDKTHRNRIVVVHKVTAKDIKRWLKVRARLDLPASLEALFVSDQRGEWHALSEGGMRQDLEERSLKAGIPRLTPNQFRNAYAVFAIRNRSDLLDVQKQMGHQSITTTARYTLVDDEGRAGRHDDHSPRGNL